MTQHDRILQYIERNGVITPMDAFMQLGITKLSTRVGELIRMGHPISKAQRTGKNRFGETVRFTEYRMGR